MQVHAWSTTNEFATTVDRKFYLNQQCKAKGIVPFPYVMLAACKPHQLLLAYAQPLEQLQLFNTLSSRWQRQCVGKPSFVQVYNTYIPHDNQLCMGKHKNTYTNMLQEQGSLCKVTK